MCVGQRSAIGLCPKKWVGPELNIQLSSVKIRINFKVKRCLMAKSVPTNPVNYIIKYKTYIWMLFKKG